MSLTPPLHFFHIKRLFLFFLFAAPLISVFSGCSGSQKFASEDNDDSAASSRIIRVHLLDSDNSYSYIVQEELNIVIDGRKRASVNKGNEIKFFGSENLITASVGSKEFSGREIRISGSSGRMSFDGKQITGHLKAVWLGGKIYFINVLPLEEYLRGVVPAEMPVGSGTENFEALKAMAVCARTYALIKMRGSGRIFDVFDSVSDQVYGGINRGNSVSDRAVEETAGMILTYNGEPAVTLYYSTCGGTTEEGINVFGSADYPYLISHSDNEPAYCEVSPRFRWEERYSKADLVNRLVRTKQLDSGSYFLQNVEIISRFPSGRVNRIDFLLRDDQSNDKVVSLYGNRMRGMLRNGNDSAMLNSNWFDVETLEDSVILKGKGYGHGVGMCQYGAMTQSKQGRKFKDILFYYYPGTKISSL